MKNFIDNFIYFDSLVDQLAKVIYFKRMSTCFDVKKLLSIWLFSIIVLMTACDPTFEYQPSGRPNGKLDVDMLTFIQTNENFTSLRAAVAKAGLNDALSGSGPLTLFAPNDEAFARFLGEQTLDEFTSEALRDLLQYHVLTLKILSPDGLGLSNEPFETLLPGKTVQLRIDDTNRVYANDNLVRTSNLEPTNGVIHVLDRVLNP